MRGLGMNKRDVDGAHEFAGGKIENPISRAIVVIPNKYAA
jgi:hypothetical protein